MACGLVVNMPVTTTEGTLSSRWSRPRTARRDRRAAEDMEESGYVEITAQPPCMPKKMSSLSSSTLNGAVYIGGGSQSEAGRPPTTVYRLDYNGGCWSELPQCEFPVSFFSLATVGGSVHLLGGLYVTNKRPVGSGQMSTSVYTFRENRWENSLPPLNLGRCRAGALGFQDYFVVAGGLTSKGRTATVEFLDTTSTKPRWITLPPLPKTLECPQVVVADGKLIVGLGFDACGQENWILYEASLESIKSYSRHQKTDNSFWTKYCDVPVKMATLATHLDTLIVVGGSTTDEDCDSRGVLAYSSNRETWHELLHLSQVRYRPAVVIVGGRRLILLGGHMSEKGLTDSVDIVHLTPFI